MTTETMWLYAAPSLKLLATPPRKDKPSVPGIVDKINALGIAAWTAKRSEIRMIGRDDDRVRMVVDFPDWGPYVIVEADLNDLPRLDTIPDLRFLSRIPDRHAEDAVRPAMAAHDAQHAEHAVALWAQVAAQNAADRLKEEHALAEAEAAARVKAARVTAEEAQARARTLAPGALLEITSGAMAGTPAEFVGPGKDSSLLVAVEMFGRKVMSAIAPQDVRWAS